MYFFPNCLHFLFLILSLLTYRDPFIFNQTLPFEEHVPAMVTSIRIGYPTGVVLLILLFVIVLFAMPCVRQRGHFQLFYWFHMLTLPWLVIMLSHGRNFWIWLLYPGIFYIIEKILRYRKTSSNSFGDTVISEAFILPSKVC